MNTKDSLYLVSLKILSDDLGTSKLFVAFKYQFNKVELPKFSDNLELIQIRNLDKQLGYYAENGVLRLCEIEPIEVIDDILQLKIDIGLSISSTSNNYVKMLELLKENERDTLLRLVGNNRQQINLYMNLENHYFNFRYDCENQSFKLAKHQKTSSIE